jgi:hypothetical protein
VLDGITAYVVENTTLTSFARVKIDYRTTRIDACNCIMMIARLQNCELAYFANLEMYHRLMPDSRCKMIGAQKFLNREMIRQDSGRVLDLS